MAWSFGVLDIETTGLSPSSQVVAIGVCKRVEQSREVAEIYSVNELSEPQVIQKLVDFFDNPAPDADLYTFNGTSFDFSMLRARTMNLSDYGDLNRKVAELEKKHHVDLAEVNRRNGNYEGLEDMADRYDIRHNSTVSGSDIPELFEQGEIGVIEEYLKEDIRVTFRLAEAVRHKMLSKG